MKSLQNDASADDLLRELIADLLPYVSMDEVMSSCLGSTKALLHWKHDLADSPPHWVWDWFAKRKPLGAVFPLGTVAERATRRLVLSVHRHGRPQPAEMVHRHLSLLIFEAALMNLRGSSDYLDRDYGFGYHWRPNGEWRSLAEEAAVAGLNASGRPQSARRRNCCAPGLPRA